MDDSKIQHIPKVYNQLLQRCEEIGFTMPSDLYIGTLLKTLIASKPEGKFLELGTGIGLSLSWMIDGMDGQSALTTVDYDQQLIDIASGFFGQDGRVEIVCMDGTEWVLANREKRYDLIFADTWAGKYNELDEVLEMVKPGGFYVIDDMVPQPNWPDGHADKAGQLINNLEQRDDYTLTKMNWSTGIVIAVRKG